MRPKITIAVAVVAAGLLSAVPQQPVADDNTEVNEVIVETMALWNEAEKLTGDERTALLVTIIASLNSIISDYPGTDIAVRLATGQAIGVLSLAAAEDALAEEVELQASTEAAAQAYAAAAELALAEAEERALAEAARASCLVEPSRACLVGEAVETANEIEDVGIRNMTLADIARVHSGTVLVSETQRTAIALAKAGNFERALAIAFEADFQLEVLGALEAVVIIQAEAALFDEAMKTADLIRNDAFRVRALVEIAKAGGDQALFAEAMEIARSIESRYQTDIAIAFSAIAGAQRDLTLLEKVMDSDRREEYGGAGWYAIAMAQAEMGRFDRALSIARTHSLIFSLARIADAQAEAGLISEALGTARSIDTRHDPWLTNSRAMALAAVAQHLD